VRRVKFELIGGLEVEFADRDQGIRQVYGLAEEGTRLPLVVFGPEGCGKSAWMRQAAEIFREEGFDTIYINPLERKVLADVGVEDVKRRLLEVAREASPSAWAKAAELLVTLAQLLLEAGRRKLAILVDEPFQLIGSGREAALYVKGLLGLIEYPPKSYERIVAIIATSEGRSRREIGRHLWANLQPMWNMPREGFRRLYEALPGDKPDFEDIWRLTGGSPRMLAQLYQEGWNPDRFTRRLIESKELTPKFISRWRVWLEAAVEDPDALWEPETPEQLVEQLVERNLIVYNLHTRDPWLWIDTPPPERDLELGIGRHVAWQTPLHREAVRRALAEERGGA